MLETVNISLPLPVFEQLQEVAQRQKRSIADTVRALVVQAGPFPSLGEGIEREIAALASFPNEVLVLLAKNPVPRWLQEELADMNYKVQTGGSLNSQEQERQKELLESYQQGILRRSYCLELLRRRGYDLSELFQMPEETVI